MKNLLLISFVIGLASFRLSALSCEPTYWEDRFGDWPEDGAEDVPLNTLLFVKYFDESELSELRLTLEDGEDVDFEIMHSYSYLHILKPDLLEPETDYRLTHGSGKNISFTTGVDELEEAPELQNIIYHGAFPESSCGRGGGEYHLGGDSANDIWFIAFESTDDQVESLDDIQPLAVSRGDRRSLFVLGEPRSKIDFQYVVMDTAGNMSEKSEVYSVEIPKKSFLGGCQSSESLMTAIFALFPFLLRDRRKDRLI